MKRLLIRRSDRVFVVGTTGSGKTYLLRKLAAPQAYVVVLDPKHQWEWGKERLPHGPGVITNKFQVLEEWEEPSPIVYRPSYDEAREGCPEFFRWLFTRGNTICVIDEVLSITPPVNIPRDFAICIQQGRSRNVALWMATQRPSRIPIPILSESEHHCVFRLRHPNDLKRMAEYTDPIVEERPARDHNFWYYNDRTQELYLLNAQYLEV
jgi:hypothetical protein